MKKNVLITILIITLTLLAATPVLANTFDQVAGGLGAAGSIFVADSGEPVGFVEAWATYVGGLAGLMSALFLILIIYAGWLWMSARGNEEQVDKAKKIMTGAVIGIIFVIFAGLIARLAITYLGDASSLRNQTVEEEI